MAQTPKDGGSAFPWSAGDPRDGSQRMSLRDYFAAQALPAVIAQYCVSNGFVIGSDHILRNAPIIAYHFADAMLQERAK